MTEEYDTNQMRLHLLKPFSVGLFIIVGKAPFFELAKNFVHTQSKIKGFIDKNTRPFIAKIYRPSEPMNVAKSKKAGSVKMWVPFK